MQENHTFNMLLEITIETYISIRKLRDVWRGAILRIDGNNHYIEFKRIDKTQNIEVNLVVGNFKFLGSFDLSETEDLLEMNLKDYNKNIDSCCDQYGYVYDSLQIIEFDDKGIADIDFRIELTK